MAFKLVVGGNAHSYVLEAIEPASIFKQEQALTGPGTRVVLNRQKRTGLEFIELISADLSMLEGVQRLKPGEFFLRDYNHRELVDALVDQEII